MQNEYLENQYVKNKKIYIVNYQYCEPNAQIAIKFVLEIQQKFNKISLLCIF